jgi:Uma2 family endonuclease
VDIDGHHGPRYRGEVASALERELTTRRWRRLEYERLVDLGIFVGERLELLDGVLVVREPQGSPHAAVVMRIGQILAVAFGAGWHPRLHAPLALGEHSEPEPDIAVVAGEALDYVAAHPSTAALVVEVADSSLRLDRRFKAAVYARAGLAEYWIVNLVDQALEVYRRPQSPVRPDDDWTYGSVEVRRPPSAVSPLALPSVQIPVADLLP